MQHALVGLLALVAVVVAGCGGRPSATGILTVVRVEQSVAGGAPAPVPNATVRYEIYGSRAADTLRYPLYHQYEDTTDANGLSVVFRGPESRGPTDIGLVLVDVTLPDGRTAFKRRPVEAVFDFKAWLGQFWAGSPATELVELICSSAEDFPGCSEVLEASGLATWGAGELFRFEPAGG